MFLNNEGSQFYVEIPKPFIPTYIKDKYKPYLNKIPSIINNATDIVNHTIQSITIPPVSYDPITQQKAKNHKNDDKARGYEVNYRGYTNPNQLLDRQFDITFKLIDGYLNYFILQDVFWHYYNYQNSNLYTFDIPVRILDANGIVMLSAIYKEVLFTGMGEFDFSYANNIQEFKTFDCSFTFNDFVISHDIA